MQANKRGARGAKGAKTTRRPRRISLRIAITLPAAFTAIRFAVTEADIIENIVRKNLPEAPFQYKPKRRMRFTT
jgi:hypothetical protein